MTKEVCQQVAEDSLVTAPVNPLKRHVYRNCLFIASLAEAMTLALILATWFLMITGKAVFGDPLTNGVVTGVFTMVGAQIALATTFSPRDDQMAGGKTWYPNVLIHVCFSVANASLVLAMGVYAVVNDMVAPEYVIVGTVIGLVFAVIGNLNGLAARFAPKE